MCCVYRLRQQHQKLILQLEQKQKQEMCDHRKALEREFENQMHMFDKEMEKLKTKHRTELEQKVILKNKNRSISTLCSTNMVHLYVSLE